MALGTAVSFLATHPTLAVDTTWFFDGSGNWTESAKWSAGEPIDDTYNVLIDDGSTAVTVTLNESRMIGRLALGTDDWLRIEAVAANDVTLSSESDFTNDGQIGLIGASTGNAALSLGMGTLTNSKSGFLIFESGGTGNRSLTANLTNLGRILVDHPTTFDKPASTYINSGEFTIDDPLTVSHPSIFEQQSGNLNLDSDIYLQPGSTFNLQGGILQLGNGGTLFMSGSIFNQTGGMLQGNSSTYYPSGIVGGTYNYLGGTIITSPVLDSVAINIGPNVDAPFTFGLRGNCSLTLADNRLKSGQTLRIGENFSSAITLPSTLTTASGFHNSGTLKIKTEFGGPSALILESGTLFNETSGILDFQTGSGIGSIFTGDLMNEGTVNANGSPTFNKSGGLYVNKGQFSSGSFKITNGGVFEQQSGTFEFLGKTPIDGGTIRILGGAIIGIPSATNAVLEIGPVFTGPASFVLQNSNTLLLANNSIAAGQSITIRNSASGTQSTVSAAGFTNNGSLLFTGNYVTGTAKLVITNGTLLNGVTGLVHFQSDLAGDRAFTGNLTNLGTVLVSRNTTFDKAGAIYANSGQFTIDQNLTISNASTIEQTGGALAANAVLSLHSGTNVNLTDGVLSLGSSGRISMFGSVLNQTGGTLSGNLADSTGIQGGTYNFEGGAISGAPMLANVAIRIGANIVDPFTFNVLGSSALSLADDRLENGQTLRIVTTSSFPNSTLTSANGFQNSGTIFFSANASSTLKVNSGTLVNEESGVIEVQSGGSAPIKTFTGNLLNAGTVLLNNLTRFDRVGGLYANNGAFTVSSSLTIGGGGVIEQQSGTFTFAGLQRIDGGTFRYLGGAIVGAALLTNATLSIGPAASSPADFVLENTNILQLQANHIAAGQSITVRNASSNTRSVTSATGFTNDGNLSVTGTGSGVARLAITNGDLENAANGFLHFQAGNGTRSFSGNLTNFGNVLIEDATTFDKNSAVYSNSGQFTIAASQTLTIADTDLVSSLEGRYEQTGGVTTVNGTMISPKLVCFLGGQLTGIGNINGNVENIAATVAPGGSSGTLTIQGDYTQQASGNLHIEISGLGPADHDVLAVAGDAMLNGTLNIALINGFAPQTGQQFNILAANNISGSLNLVGPLASLFKVVQSNAVLTLQVVNTLFPGDFNLDGTVDTADFVAWRKTDGTPASYDAWRTHFGASLGEGSGSAGHPGGGSAESPSPAVPEPATNLLMIIGACGVFSRQYRATLRVSILVRD